MDKLLIKLTKKKEKTKFTGRKDITTDIERIRECYAHKECKSLPIN